MPRTQRRLLRSIALLAAAVVVLAACGSDKKDNNTSSGGGAAKTVALAFVGPLTGDNANLGINIRDGAKVAVDQANKAGGKYKFVLKPYDTQGDPAQAPTQADKYVNDDQILGVVGPTFSGETKAVLPTLEQEGLVMISASATNVDLPTVVKDGKVFHRLVPDDDVQGVGIAQWITKHLKGHNLAYINDNSDYGKGLADGTKAVVEKAGAATVLEDTIDPKAQDFSSTVSKVKAANPDVIFYGGYYSEAGRLMKQLTDAGVKSIFVSGDGSLDPGFITAGGTGAEGAQLTCACNLATTDSPDAKLATFATDYKSVNSQNPGTYSTEGYDAASILIKGITAGNDTREKLLTYVEGITTFPGLSKSISFEGNGNVKAGDVFIFDVKGGKIVLQGTAKELVGAG